MKKYYLSVSKRRLIIEHVLRAASKMESDMKQTIGQTSRDSIEENIQELRLIAALLEVKDGEED